MNSYSQYGEDLVVYNIFKNIALGRTPRLLDIGAWDPIEKSNSRLLIEQGWAGVLIEPSPMPLRNLIQAYGQPGSREDVMVVSAAVGLDRGMVRMQITDDAVSTSKPEVAELWKTAGGYFGHAWFPVITLQDIFTHFGGEFDFVNIDAEGLSVELAQQYLATEAFPFVMCVEHDSRIVELMQAAQARGYVAHHTNGTNIILVHNR